jgi:hypothetical protein
MKTKLAYIAALSVSLSSCASIVGKSTYNVVINNPNKVTTFKVKDVSNNTLAQGTTSATASLKSSSSFFTPATYRIVSYKNSVETASQPLEGTINPWIFGNLVNFTGLVGFAVDGATGAMYKLPESVTIYAQ